MRFHPVAVLIMALTACSAQATSQPPYHPPVKNIAMLLGRSLKDPQFLAAAKHFGSFYYADPTGHGWVCTYQKAKRNFHCVQATHQP